jgi:hypothetical protein
VVLIEQRQQIPDLLRIPAALAHHVGFKLLYVDDALKQ